MLVVVVPGVHSLLLNLASGSEQSSLLPHLMLFDGYNRHSVVIMDNCSVHHVNGIQKMIEEMGAIVHFLPPYRPDFNPIEDRGLFKSKSSFTSTGYRG